MRVFGTLLLAALLMAVLQAGCSRGTNPSAEAAEVELIDLRGGPIDLEMYKGKVVLVNFWATWCAPCRVEIPWLIAFQQKYAGRGFTVLGVAMDEEGREAVAPYVEQERFEVNGRQVAINYPILLGGEAVERQFDGLIGLPTSVLIDREGRRVRRVIGLIDHNRLAEEIEKLLGDRGGSASPAQEQGPGQ
ncbi:MAG: TlpA family protein disulfide reductase [Firmicutes bacterium]|nr:TlpA family protein disulfide reductase [Bacillota bacterium]